MIDWAHHGQTVARVDEDREPPLCLRVAHERAPAQELPRELRVFELLLGEAAELGAHRSDDAVVEGSDDGEVGPHRGAHVLAVGSLQEGCCCGPLLHQPFKP